MAFLDAVSQALSSAAGGSYGPDVKPGTVAAWALTFHADGQTLGDALLSVSSDVYDASITATLPEDLGAGSYEVVLEGMTDDDYAKVRRVTPLAAQLYLWWKDSPGLLGDLANLTGLSDPFGALTPKPPDHSLVSVLRVDSISRRAGQRRYEAVFTLRERVVARLDETRVQGLCYGSLDDAVQALGRAAGIPVKTHGLKQATPGKNDPEFATTTPGKALAALGTGRGDDHRLLDQARAGLRLFGPRTALIREGTLHVGQWNDTPLADRTIDEAGGLVAVQRGAEQKRDPGAGDPPANAPQTRSSVTITALGRPDVKPGDTVNVVLPPADFPHTQPSTGAAVLTSLLGVVAGSFTDGDDAPPSTCLVTGASHRLSRRNGFVTTIQAVVLASTDDQGWDPPSTDPAPSPDRNARAPGGPSADTAVALAGSIRDIYADVAGAARARLGQIRQHPASTQTGATPPRHTSQVWYADTGGDGLPALTQRMQVAESHHGETQQVPYLTPFAWGHYGLVLPRYPGTRVFLTTGAGGDNDLVDLGAVWPRDGGPPSEAGDYWLALPIGIEQRADIADSDGAAPDGVASHDLIDGDGTRVIETKRFVVRVTDQPTECTSRPEPGDDAPDGSVCIQTRSSGGNASIVLKEDGSIEVKGTKISFETDGDITLKADNVKVQVTTGMDVS
ncbi:MAG TPA: hypothetical protein VHW64_13700 [Nocardioides sp.]|jgi:hypothetical protein|uniref:hypothetical protein n=1 Tax=Nocardioides sp. TaxID=35761 RepID=UPI002E310740|nr:hypothetical protein [Nocardioides sp.]HEX3931755.1 hypothetical protein [Nocardioides sp.]